MNRIDLQLLADLRVREAEVLLNNGCFEGAYYLAGYAIECALKACIAKLIREHEFPDKKFANDSYTHDPERLLLLTGRKTEHAAEEQVDPLFAWSWGVVKDWSESARYAHPVVEKQALDLFAAVTDPQHGVLPWIKKSW